MAPRPIQPRVDERERTTRVASMVRQLRDTVRCYKIQTSSVMSTRCNLSLGMCLLGSMQLLLYSSVRIFPYTIHSRPGYLGSHSAK